VTGRKPRRSDKRNEKKCTEKRRLRKDTCSEPGGLPGTQAYRHVTKQTLGHWHDRGPEFRPNLFVFISHMGLLCMFWIVGYPNVSGCPYMELCTTGDWHKQWGLAQTVGSKSYIPCCALLVRQVRATFASDSQMWHASGLNLAHSQADVTRKICVRCASCSPVHHANVARTCRARSAQQGMLLLDPSVLRLFEVDTKPFFASKRHSLNNKSLYKIAPWSWSYRPRNKALIWIKRTKWL
jgi:hypothetical protein